jgi:hypothetical protein
MQLRENFPELFSHLPDETIQLFTPSILASWHLAQVDGEAMERIVFAGYFFPSASEPEIADFMERFRSKFRISWPSQITVDTYNAVNLLASSMESKCGSRESLTSQLNGIGITQPAFKGIGGEIVPSRKNETKRAYLFRLRKGNYSLIQ